VLHFCISWTPANSIGTRAAHPSRIRVLSEHRESTDPSQSQRKGPNSSPRSVRLFSRRSTSLSPFFSTFAYRVPFEQRCESPFPQVEMGLFCTILVQSKPFRCNTSEPPPMCCKQRTCAIPKSFRCNTYKKHTGWGVVLISYLLFDRHLSRTIPPLPGGAQLGVN